MTKYPAQIDTSVTLPSAVDNFTPVAGATVNRLRDAVLAIEAELGVKPSGVYGTVKGRLDTIENALSVKGGIISLAQDLGGTYPLPFVVGLQGRALSSTAPTVGQFIAWDGYTWKPSYGVSSTYLTQANWYVDWINGNDNNPGTLVSPVKTIMGGIVAKWGTSSPTLPQTTTINILTSQPLGAEKIFLSPTLTNISSLLIVGTPTASGASFTLGSVTAQNISTKQLWQATNFTGKTQGQLVVNVTRNNSRALILSVVGSTATLTQPIEAFVPGITTNFFPTPTQHFDWQAGDTVQVYNLPHLNLIDFTAFGTEDDLTFAKGGAVIMQNLYIPDQSGSLGTTYFGPRYQNGIITTDSCIFEPSGQTPNGTPLINCINSMWLYGGEFGFTFFNGGAITGVGGAVFTSLNWLDGYVIIDSSTAASSNPIYCGWAAVSANGQIILHPGSAIEIRQLWYLGPQGGALFGPGALHLQPQAACVRRLPTPSWTSCLNLTTLTLPSNVTTGTAYNAGVFTGGIALTSANLDTNHGLQDPRTGARFCEDL